MKGRWKWPPSTVWKATISMDPQLFTVRNVIGVKMYQSANVSCTQTLKIQNLYTWLTLQQLSTVVHQILHWTVLLSSRTHTSWLLLTTSVMPAILGMAKRRGGVSPVGCGQNLCRTVRLWMVRKQCVRIIIIIYDIMYLFNVHTYFILYTLLHHKINVAQIQCAQH